MALLTERISPYLDAVLARVGQVGHLSTCAGVLFYQRCPGPGKPASQTFCRDLEEIFQKWSEMTHKFCELKSSPT